MKYRCVHAIGFTMNQTNLKNFVNTIQNAYTLKYVPWQQMVTNGGNRDQGPRNPMFYIHTYNTFASYTNSPNHSYVKLDKK